MTEEVTIDLDQFLKTCGVSTGGQAKLLIQGGDVLVNGEVETRRRRSLRAGDEVSLGDDVFVVAAVEQSEKTEPDTTNSPVFDCIDIGANLTHKSFQNDLQEVVGAARASGVSKIVLTGSCLRSSQETAEFAGSNAGFLFSTAGIHPHDAKSFDEHTVSVLKPLLEKPQVVAVGECGLDFNRDFSPRDAQVRCFEEHLKLAVDIQKPMFLHERDAFEAFYDLTKKYRDSISRGVVHCFTGTEESLRAYLDLDFHIGITGWICDERRGQHLRELVKLIPVNRLMIETDSPYLAPRDIRPRIRRNEPQYLPHILNTVAACRGVDAHDLSVHLLETTNRFFEI